MFNVEQTILNDVANSVIKYRLFPIFNGCNYILISMAVREDAPQSGNQAFSRKHPFACWLATMLMCFASNILASFLLGDSILSTLQEVNDIILASACWYLINYSPFDLFYKICKLGPIKFILCMLKEVQRTKKIFLGVRMASRKHPNNILLWLTIGVLKGSGYYFMKIVERLVRGIWLPASNEFLKPSFNTKASLSVSILFALVHLGKIKMGANLDFLIAMIFLLYFRFVIILFGVHDPYVPFENIFCGVFFGGLVDAARNAWRKSVTKSDDLKSATLMKTGTVSENGAGGTHTFSENTNLTQNKPKEERKKDV